MHLAYYDESGDDGNPGSSPLFVFSTVYLHHADWKDTFEEMKAFRRYLSNNYGMPVKTEMHTKHFLTNKNPYFNWGFPDRKRVEILEMYCQHLASLSVKIINVVIDKQATSDASYGVLDHALQYSIQRIENDLKRINPDRKFMIITDPGRVGKMRKIARRVRAINYIPSNYGNQSYRQDIKSLIEDPLPKDSKESYFIQAADLVAYIVYMHKLAELNISSFSNRIPSSVTPRKVEQWLKMLEPALNVNASRQDRFGIVCYPRRN